MVSLCTSGADTKETCSAIMPRANCKHPNLLWYQASPTGLYNHLQTVCDNEMTLDFNGATHLWLRWDSG